MLGEGFVKERQGARAQARTRSEGNDASEVSPFLSMYLDGPRARLLLGFAAFSAWVNLLIGFEGFLRDTVVYGGGVVRDPLFVAALLLGGALLIAAALRQRPFLQLPEDGEMPRWRGAAVCGILGSLSGVAGVALSSSATTAGSVVMTLAVVLGMMAAVFIARYTLAWGVLIASFDLREMMVALCTALCLQWVPFIAVQFLGAVGKAVLAGGLPLLSLWGLRGFTSTPSESASSREGSSAGEAEGDSRWIVARMAAALFCFAFVVQFVWTRNVVMTSEPLDQGLFWLVYLCVFVACAVIMIAILCLMDRWGAYRMELFYRAAFAFGVVGSAALPLAYNHLFFSYAVIYVAYALMSAAMWLLVWSVVFMRHVPPRRVVGLVFGLQYIALPCGFGAAKLMQQLAAASASSDLLPYVGFSAITLLVVAFVFVLPERTLLLLSPRLLRLSHESLDERCREVAVTHGLTERETEIFALLARGRDVGYIEKELFISRNTVNTHRKNLYRKLGIHTQQELLSLIEASLN